MSDGYHAIPSTGGARSNFSGGSTVAPTRPRKRIYDSEVSPDEEVLARRPGHYAGYHESIKGVAPYKKGERLARYTRRPENGGGAGGASAGGGSTSATSLGNSSSAGAAAGSMLEPSKTAMMEDDEDVNQGLADNFDDSLCGLGSDMSASTYNMSEALHALPLVPSLVKQESVSPRMMDNLAGALGNSVFDENSQSNSLDKIIKLLTNDNSFEGAPPTSISQILGQHHHHHHLPGSAATSTFSPSPSEDALSPPSPPPSVSSNSTSLLHSQHSNHHHQQHSLHHQQLFVASQHQQQNHLQQQHHHHHQQQLQHLNQQHSEDSPPDLDEDPERTSKILGLSSNSSLLSEDGLGCDDGADCGVGDGGGPDAGSLVDGGAGGIDPGGDDMLRRFRFDDQFSTPVQHGIQNYDDNRFQYILSVPTSTAVKQSEDTLSYLNQGQSYEIKIKKLGDITKCVGKKFTSLIRICFHERRFQYVEREQLNLWHQVRPNERMIEIDVPLSFGISDVQQSKGKVAVVQFDWDPSKEVSAYIKVNCISTEFTQRKHGGEKGVPFRIQIETYANNNGTLERLYVCGCQIKVFKLKGADRKHKQDREKISKLAPGDREKYQESCECTIMSTYVGDMIFQPDDRWNSTTGSSTSNNSNSSAAGGAGGAGASDSLPTSHSFDQQQQSAGGAAAASNCSPPHSACTTTNTSPVEQRKMHSFTPIKKTEGGYSPAPSASEQDNFCGSSSAVNGVLEGDESYQQIQQWLTLHRFSRYSSTFSNFTATDILRLSRQELIEICGLADGIRLFNALHAKSLVPRLTLYVCAPGESVYSAVYLERATYKELVRKLAALFGLQPVAVQDVYVQGPSGIHVKLNDEVVRNFTDEGLLVCTAYPTSSVSPSAVDTKPFLPPASTIYTLVLKAQPKPSSSSPPSSNSPPASSSSSSSRPLGEATSLAPSGGGGGFQQLLHTQRGANTAFSPFGSGASGGGDRGFSSHLAGSSSSPSLSTATTLSSFRFGSHRTPISSAGGSLDYESLQNDSYCSGGGGGAAGGDGGCGASGSSSTTSSTNNNSNLHNSSSSSSLLLSSLSGVSSRQQQQLKQLMHESAGSFLPRSTPSLNGGGPPATLTQPASSLFLQSPSSSSSSSMGGGRGGPPPSSNSSQGMGGAGSSSNSQQQQQQQYHS